MEDELTETDKQLDFCVTKVIQVVLFFSFSEFFPGFCCLHNNARVLMLLIDTHQKQTQNKTSSALIIDIELAGGRFWRSIVVLGDPGIPHRIETSMVTGWF